MHVKTFSVFGPFSPLFFCFLLPLDEQRAAVKLENYFISVKIIFEAEEIEKSRNRGHFVFIDLIG